MLTNIILILKYSNNITLILIYLKQGGHCSGEIKTKDFSRTFKHPHNLFRNLFHHSFQQVKQLYNIKSIHNTDVVYSSPMTATLTA